MNEIIDNIEKIKDFDNIAQQLDALVDPREESKEQAKPTCCSIGKLGKLCLCNKILYKIRPYSFDLIRAIQPFFEMIAISNLAYNVLE